MKLKFRFWDGKAMVSIGPIDGGLMQFTGLYDRNNQEIYEGDIISDGSYTGVVKWSDSEAQFVVDFGDGSIEALASEVYNPSCKVVGNKYQGGVKSLSDFAPTDYEY